MSGTKNVHKQLGKGNNYREISGKFAVVASTAYEKVNTTGTDKNLFRLVPEPGHSARVLALKVVPVPGHGAQISARAPTKGCVQTGAHRARGPSLNRAQAYIAIRAYLTTVTSFHVQNKMQDCRKTYTLLAPSGVSKSLYRLSIFCSFFSSRS